MLIFIMHVHFNYIIVYIKWGANDGLRRQVFRGGHKFIGDGGEGVPL